jgi:cell pole-organizing protein PopZ
MENLLASIRQAIDSDLGTGAPVVRQPTAASIKGAMDELRVRANAGTASRNFEVSHEINELREKISRNRSFTPEPKTPFAQIMAGQVKLPNPPASLPVPVQAPASYATAAAPQQVYPVQGYGQAESAPPAYEAEAQEWQDEPYGAQAYEPDPPLVSQETAYAAQSSFNELAQALMARATGERSIEDITQELLRTMLRNWLDANLPAMVERLVREEIERVARRGR